MTVFTTNRLVVRVPSGTDDEVDVVYRLWTDPQVMANVGFPKGLGVSRESIARRLRAETGSVYERVLVVELAATRAVIGECKLGLPDDAGVAHTDIKLLPEYWGYGYGTETKQGLLDYLFIHTDARAVKGTPNKGNMASRRMQEKVGGKLVREGIHHFPEHMRGNTVDVPYYEYQVTRKDWLARRAGRD